MSALAWIIKYPKGGRFQNRQYYAAGSTTTRRQRVLMAWFDIRGIGSVCYLMYAINHRLDAGLAEPFIAITLTVVATSIVIHGISVTPLMQRYARRKPSTGRALF